MAHITLHNQLGLEVERHSPFFAINFTLNGKFTFLGDFFQSLSLYIYIYLERAS